MSDVVMPTLLAQAPIYIGTLAVLSALYIQYLAPDVPLRYPGFLYVLGMAIVLYDTGPIVGDVPGFVIGTRVAAILLFGFIVVGTCTFVAARYNVPNPLTIIDELRTELKSGFR